MRRLFLSDVKEFVEKYECFTKQNIDEVIHDCYVTVIFFIICLFIMKKGKLVSLIFIEFYLWSLVCCCVGSLFYIGPSYDVIPLVSSLIAYWLRFVFMATAIFFGCLSLWLPKIWFK